MPRAPKICSNPSCGHISPCPDHPKIAWQGSNRRSELPRDWPKRVAAVLARDPICTDGRCCGGLALSRECHHIGDPMDHRLESLAGICKACHKAATAEQAAAGRVRRA